MPLTKEGCLDQGSCLLPSERVVLFIWACRLGQRIQGIGVHSMTGTVIQLA